MAVDQLPAPLPLNDIVPGTEEDSWGPFVSANWALIRQAVVDLIAVDNEKADLVNGVIPSDQLPTQTSAVAAEPVANEAAMLGLSGATQGKIVVRADNGKFYALKQTPASTLANWIEVQTGVGVTTINGEAGAVTGYLKLNVNSQTVTATGFTFNNPVVVGAATLDTHAVTRGQMNTAVAAVSGSSTSKKTFLIGNGSATTFNVDHNLNTLSVLVQVWDVDTGLLVRPGISVLPANLNRVTLTFGEAPGTNERRVVII